MGKFVDLTGRNFGRLVVIKKAQSKPEMRWECRCECGNTTIVSGKNLNRGHTQSCGCLGLEKLKDAAKIARVKHGMCGTKFYETWCSIKKRCYCKTFKRYNDYGGRGIVVCNEWLHSFDQFYKDMYDEYVKHSDEYGEHDTLIERLDNDGTYSKENCIWATYKTQARNKRNTVTITFYGNQVSAAELGEQYGIASDVIIRRYRKGLKNEEIITGKRMSSSGD